MSSLFRNIVLIVAISAVIIMMIGIFLYDYIPTGVKVSKASSYETSEKTTKILSDASDASSLLNQSDDTDSPVQTNIILQTYNVSKTDLAIYKSMGSYQSGRPDPFADIDKPAASTGSTSGTGTGSSSGTTTTPGTTTTTNTSTGSNSTSQTGSSDGTFYNSTYTK
jgi:hypothetical protein